MRRYLEFALLAVMIGGLSLYLLRALESARADVEEAVVQADAAAIRISLMEIATRRAMLGGNYPDSDNPINWLGSPVGHSCRRVRLQAGGALALVFRQSATGVDLPVRRWSAGAFQAGTQWHGRCG